MHVCFILLQDVDSMHSINQSVMCRTSGILFLKMQIPWPRKFVIMLFYNRIADLRKKDYHFVLAVRLFVSNKFSSSWFYVNFVSAIKEMCLWSGKVLRLKGISVLYKFLSCCGTISFLKGAVLIRITPMSISQER